VITCLHCGAETSNGLALCAPCQQKTRTIFEFLPIYFRNLARWRPGRAGSRPAPGSRVLYDGHIQGVGTGDLISDTLDETFTMLTTRARELVNDRPHFIHPLTLADAVLADDMSDEMADTLTDNPAQAIAALCAGFQHHLTSISTLDWCGDFVTDLSQHEERLRALTETHVPGWYAGGCRQVTGFDDEGAAVRCGTPTYVVPGLTWATCDACGVMTYARDYIDTVLDEARGWVARPKALAEAIVALVDTEASVPNLHDRIRQWSARGRIDGIRRLDDDGDEIGPRRYQLGDVLDAVLCDTKMQPKQASVS
jgi:hypothetical protein